MPHWKCGLAGPLCAWLAYHLDLRCFRRRGGLRQAARPGEDGIANAIGIAASQSAGIVENLPSAAKNVSVGNAARNGLFSALLSEGGYAASATAIEGPLGWARAMGDQPDIEALTGGLGESWEIAKNTYKPYPAGIVFHSVIDACFKLRTQLGGMTDDIVSITVQGSALLLARGDRAVVTERDARVSIHHSVACVLQCGAAGVREFSEAVVFQPEVILLRAKVVAELDASLPDGAARVSILTGSGKRLSRASDVRQGKPRQSADGCRYRSQAARVRAVR